MKARLGWLALALIVALLLLARRSSPQKQRVQDETASSRLRPAQAPATQARRSLVRSPQRPALPAHPAADERELIQHEVALVGALNDALDLRDASRMRRLLEDYRAYHPTDDNQLQEGYERIADCLDSLDDESRAAAQTYYDDARASTLRRFVRRICLDTPEG